MDSLDRYLALQQEIHDYFGYKEDYRILPMVDQRGDYWMITGTESDGQVAFHEDKAKLKDVEGGEYYENEIYTQRFLPKWVYRGEKFTMICVDTHTDGNQYLQIFSNDKEL